MCACARRKAPGVIVNKYLFDFKFFLMFWESVMCSFYYWHTSWMKDTFVKKIIWNFCFEKDLKIKYNVAPNLLTKKENKTELDNN